jgi:hypothetical protein
MCEVLIWILWLVGLNLWLQPFSSHKAGCSTTYPHCPHHQPCTQVGDGASECGEKVISKFSLISPLLPLFARIYPRHVEPMTTRAAVGCPTVAAVGLLGLFLESQLNVTYPLAYTNIRAEPESSSPTNTPWRWKFQKRPNCSACTPP